jgi:hypothetical protein
VMMMVMIILIKKMMMVITNMVMVIKMTIDLNFLGLLHHAVHEVLDGLVPSIGVTSVLQL